MTALLALFIGGLLAGYMNAIAGAGSLLTLPLLIFSGLDAASANASNRVAVLAQCLVTTRTFIRGNHPPGPLLRVLALPALIGTVLGAWLASSLSERSIQLSIAVVLIVMLPPSLMRLRPSTRKSQQTAPGSWWLWTGFAAIGCYAGFIQAATGILILLVLHKGYGVNLAQANTLKVALIAMLSVVALCTFAINGVTIDWTRGGILALGSSIGGYFGAHAAMQRGEKWIRLMVAIAIALSAIKLMF